MDSGVKLFLTVVIAASPFYLHNFQQYLLLGIFLCIITIFSKIAVKTLLRNLLVYLFIIVLPYAFGLGVANLMYKFTGNHLFLFHDQLYDMLLRLFNLFLLWYATSLYIFTTANKDILAVFDKLLTPLKKLGLPVSDYLLVISFVLQDLSALGPKLKAQFSAEYKQKQSIVNIIVTQLVNSFQRLDEIELHLTSTDQSALFDYRLTFSKYDIYALIAVLNLLLIFYFAR